MKTRSQGDSSSVVAVVMEEVTASPPPPVNARYDELFADAKELEAVLANVKRPGVRMHLQTIIANYHKECEFLQRFAAGGDLALSDFICQHVVKYLGVRGLVRFGAVCRNLSSVVSKEITRRKERVAAIEIEVSRLMIVKSCIVKRGTQYNHDISEEDLEEHVAPPTRANVHAARKLAGEAERLIDDEINFHDKFWNGTETERWKWDDYVKRANDVFRDERTIFLMGPEHIRSIRETRKRAQWNFRGTLVILPDCFFFPPHRDWITPTQDNCYDANCVIGGYMDFGGSVDQVAQSLYERGAVDAFRYKARNWSCRDPHLLNFLKRVLERADKGGFYSADY